MSACTVKLLQAASEVAGSNEALARRLGVSKRLLAKFMADVLELPDPLLLRAVDIILADRAAPVDGDHGVQLLRASPRDL